MDPRENCERTFVRVPHPFRGQFIPSSLSLPNLPRSRWRYPHRAPSPPNGSASRPAPCVAALHPEGFEPPTLGFEDRCSIQLSYECYAFLRNVLREPKSRISRPLQPEKVTLKCVTCRASAPSKPTTLTRVAECLHKNDHGTYFALLKVHGKQIKKIPHDEGRSRSEATPGAPPSEGPKSTLSGREHHLQQSGDPLAECHQTGFTPAFLAKTRRSLHSFW